MTKKTLLAFLNIILKDLKNLNLDLIQKKDTRGKLFKLEGILRLYVKHPPKDMKPKNFKFFEDSLVLVKAIEDSLGAAFFDKEAWEYAQDKLNKEDLKTLEEQWIKSQKQLKKEFKDKSYLKKLTAMTKTLSSLDFKKDKFIKKSIKKEIKRINKKIQKDLSPLIQNKKYSDHDIEEGVHEWRRMIRWITIYFQGHKDIFNLNLAPKNKSNSLVKTYKNNIFCQLGSNKAPYQIDALKFYQLSDYIVKVGDLKTEAELSRFLKGQGYKIKEVSIEKECHKLLKSFISQKPLKKIFVKK